jgi:transcriptional regulator with XRE-family HTH domain
MENLGQKISELRKKHNLTQSELGEKLNVTSQAVSKWENNLSEPDLETTKKLCEIFDVSMNELLSVEITNNNETPAPTPSPVKEEQPQPKIILGYCKQCNKPVSNGEYQVSADGIGVICNACERTRRFNVANSNYHEDKRSFIAGLVWGGIAFIALLVIGIILDATSSSSTPFVLIGLGLGFASFALISECIWDGSALDVLLFFCRSFTMPGIIFTWDWDGIKFLIIMKITFAILSAVLSVAVFAIGLVVSLVYATILFPFSLIATIKNLNELKS